MRRPPKNINTVALKDIGKFQNSDVKGTTLPYLPLPTLANLAYLRTYLAGITWDESEDAQYEGWAFTNVLHFQHEAVGFMRFEDVLVRSLLAAAL